MKKVVVIGAGLTGSIIARRYKDLGYDVTVVERREHVGGNVSDYIDTNGAVVHRYGPHFFHTNNEEVYSFITKYCDWVEYKLKCSTELNIDGHKIVTPTPFNFNTADKLNFKLKISDLKNKLLKYGKEIHILDALEDKEISAYAEMLYTYDYAPYAAKQWQIPVSQLDKSVLGRVKLRNSYEDTYFEDKYQLLPKTSYNDLFNNLLNGINLIKDNASIKIENNKAIYKDFDIVVYTGAIDELFSCCNGKLPYRSLRFEYKQSNENKFENDIVAYPAEEYTRITKYGTYTYAYEYSVKYEGTNEPYYPVLTEESNNLYNIYKNRANDVDNLICCGRLADFKYYNMDQAIENALHVELIK